MEKDIINFVDKFGQLMWTLIILVTETKRQKHHIRLLNWISLSLEVNRFYMSLGYWSKSRMLWNATTSKARHNYIAEKVLIIGCRYVEELSIVDCYFKSAINIDIFPIFKKTAVQIQQNKMTGKGFIFL